MAIPWPSRQPAPVCGIATSIAWISLRTAKPVPRGSPFLLPGSTRLSNPAGIRHWDVGGAAGHALVPHQHHGVQGPSPVPESCGERVPTGAKSKYQKHESVLTALGLQSLIKMIKRLQGWAGSLARGWRQRWGDRLGWFLSAKRCELGKVCSCPLLCCSRCSCSRWLRKELSSQGQRRGSPDAQVPTLPRAQLNSCDKFSPLSVNASLLRHSHTYLGDPLCSAPRDTIAIFLFTLGLANF